MDNIDRSNIPSMDYCPYNIDITVTNLPQSAETRSTVAIRVERLVNQYTGVRNSPPNLTSSYHFSPPQLVNFDITSTTTSSQIIEILHNQHGLTPWLSRDIVSQICGQTTDMDLDCNAITIDVLVTISFAIVSFWNIWSSFMEEAFNEGDDESVVKKLVQDGVIGEKLGLETESCSICLENLLEVSKKVPTRMPCSHVFHDRCISQWLSRKNSCPICRRVLLER